ncbi:MAG: response regulator [Planctomycetota bacterium]|nr:MAG: response regulator [Planctomycetota bacterium]
MHEEVRMSPDLFPHKDAVPATPEAVMQLLLVEDNEDEALITQAAFQRQRVPVRIDHVADGRTCLTYLRREKPFERATLPDLVLLDLNMPGMDGRQVMATIASDARLRYLPVIVLTTSSAPDDVLEMYRMRCNSYIVKPIDLSRLEAIAARIIDYWTGASTLPTRLVGDSGDNA